jgi:hypothetical protein
MIRPVRGGEGPTKRHHPPIFSSLSQSGIISCREIKIPTETVPGRATGAKETAASQCSESLLFASLSACFSVVHGHELHRRGDTRLSPESGSRKCAPVIITQFATKSLALPTAPRQIKDTVRAPANRTVGLIPFRRICFPCPCPCLSKGTRANLRTGPHGLFFVNCALLAFFLEIGILHLT